MNPQDILRFDRKVPRYTSHPTAADFNDGFDNERYRQGLAGIPEEGRTIGGGGPRPSRPVSRGGCLRRTG
jgi:hypothetical protein